MSIQYSPKNNPRVIIIQKRYGKFFNNEEILTYPKHRFKKFIKDVVFGTIERNDILIEELDKNLGEEFRFHNLDRLFQVILKSATYELLYKPNVSIKIIIKELRKQKTPFCFLVKAEGVFIFGIHCKSQVTPSGGFLSQSHSARKLLSDIFQ